MTKRFLSLTMLTALLCVFSAEARPLLPDLTTESSYLHDNDIVTSGGRVLLRLANGTGNRGEGKLELRGLLPANPDGTQDVVQRIYDTNGSYTERVAGKFVYHPQHDHIHVEDWSVFRLREILPGNGVGPIIAEGDKVSFCILDITVVDDTLPGYSPNPEFSTCGGTIQGLSVGYADIYGKTLPDQYIDITGLPDGTYWLEAEVDPKNNILELDETNNIGRVQVTIGQPVPITPDAYEPNNTDQEVLARRVGLQNSPNLGPCDPVRTIQGLSIDSDGDQDRFRFYIPERGGVNHQVRIDFIHGLGDLDMRLFNDVGGAVGTSTGVTNAETIPLSGLGAGWYTVEVYGYNGATKANYNLTIVPPSNGTPTIDVLEPAAGNQRLVHGIDQARITWQADDPERNEMWVSVWANTRPAFDGNEVYVSTNANTPANVGVMTVNSAYLQEDATYHFYLEVTDGGSRSGDWAPGTITFEHNHGNKGLQDYHFHPGWTSFALSVEPTDTMHASDFVAMAKDWNMSINFLSRLHRGRWQVYVPGIPMNDFAMVPGEGYFLHHMAHRDFFLPGRGIALAVPLNLTGGWDFVGFPHAHNVSTAADVCDLLDQEGLGGNVVATWAGYYGPGWEVYYCGWGGSDFTLDPKKGYLVHSLDAGRVMP